MQLISRSYLTGIVFRAINNTIQERRASQQNQLFYLNYPTATEEEFWDFIQSIPYFDAELKNFLISKLADESIIVSQPWETSFIVKTKQWASTNEWLHVDVIVSLGFYAEYFMLSPDYLKLPY